MITHLIVWIILYYIFNLYTKVHIKNDLFVQLHLMDKTNAFYAEPLDIGVNDFFDSVVQ